MVKINRKLSVAPMMDWTDRHCRYLHRIISKHTLLYTEMVTAPALIHGDADRLLAFDKAEHPVALQIGGSSPEELARATKMGADAGYVEVNLNIGCPSDRVQSGRFGACLMKEPSLVAECLSAMLGASSGAEITAKCRIGVDDQIPSDTLPAFVEMLKGVGITSVTIHARMAWLDGLSPKQNRDIPPLNYPLVAQIKRDNPELEIIINGGVTTLAEAKTLLNLGLDGVMIGRAAYHKPMQILGGADAFISEVSNRQTPARVIKQMKPYIENHLEKGGRLNQITRHMMGLFADQPGTRLWKRSLSETAHKEGANYETVSNALSRVLEAQKETEI